MELVSQADIDLVNEIEQELKHNKIILLLRGCPGSGKTTLANWLQKEFREDMVTVLSTNNLIEDKQGVYRSNNASLRKAYKETIRRAEELMNKQRMFIIIDDKNIKSWEMTPYLEMAKKYSYTVKITETNTPWRRDPDILAEKNVHGVSAKRIFNMLDDFQSFTVDQLVNMDDGKPMLTQKRKASPEESEVPQKGLAEIMQEEKFLEISFREKCPFADDKEFIELCQLFYDKDRLYLAQVFEQNKFNLDRSIWILRKEEDEQETTKIVMSTVGAVVPKRRQKLALVINYQWLQTSRILINLETVMREISKSTSMYKQLLTNIKMIKDMTLKEKANLIIEILYDLKADTAKKRILKASYNEVDMHLLIWVEALFICKESIYDYNEALVEFPDMKRSIKFITGKGLHSKNGKPILRPKLEEYLKKNNFQYTAYDGCLKVHLSGNRNSSPERHLCTLSTM